MKRLAVLVVVLAIGALAALAQDDEPAQTDENGFLINLLTDAISAPGREVGLSGVSGALSSQARIERITVSDDAGAWLVVENVAIDWSRAQLLLGRLNVEQLAIGRVALLRRPEPPRRRLPPPEADDAPFALPELPVAVRLNALAVDEIAIAEDIFGQAALLALEGRLTLAGGELETALEVVRQDGPGGSLDLEAAFSNQSRELAVDLALTSPPGGLLDTVLGIEGDPAIDLRITGAGPLDDVDVEFSLDADGDRLAAGVVALRGSDAGLGFEVDFSGTLSPLLPAEFRGFFEGETSVEVSGLSKSGGGLRVSTAAVRGAALDLDGRLETGADGFLQSLNLSGTLGDPAGEPVVLPVPGADTRLTSAALRVNYGGGSRWDGLLVLDRLEAGDLAIEDLTLDMGGIARNLQDPDTRAVTVNVQGLATGVWSDDPRIRQVLGPRLDLFVDAELPAGGPVRVSQFQLSGNGLSAFTAGSFENRTYDGRASLRVADIAVLSGLAGRPLAGAVALRAEGSVRPLGGAFDLTFDGGVRDVSVGDPRLDPLLAGATAISGRAVRDATGIRTEDLRIENPQLSFVSDGRISTRATDFGFEARLNDLALVDPRLAGSLTARGRAEGDGLPVTVRLEAAVPQGALMGRDVSNLEVGFDGTVGPGGLAGSLSGGGLLDALVVDLAGEIAVDDTSRSVSDLRLAVGPNTLTATLRQEGSTPAAGRIALDAPQIAPLAALALVEAEGAAQAVVTLADEDGGQRVEVTAQARDVRAPGVALEQAEADLRISDALGLPLVDGSLSARGLAAAGLEVAALSAEARQSDPDRMEVEAEARLAIGTLVDASGALERLPDGFAATLATLRLRQGEALARLEAPATVTFREGAVDLTPLALDFGTGRLTAEGRIGEEIDLAVAAEALPLDLVNTVRPDLDAAGRITGTVQVTGPRAAPDVSLDVGASDVALAATRAAGLPPLAAQMQGESVDGGLRLDASLSSQNGLSASASGLVPLGQGEFDLDVALDAFPLALVDRLAGGQGLAGTVTGTAQVGGSAAAPEAEFALRGTGITARPLREAGVPSLEFTLDGGFADGTVRLAEARVSGPPGLALSASGTVPLSGPGLDVRASGEVPLALADPVLEQRAVQARGILQIDASATGSLASPSFGGNLSLAGGTITDPILNIRLEDVRLDAGLSGTTVQLRQFAAAVSAGGSISAEGTLGLTQGFPADIDVRIDRVRYTDGAFVTTTLDGALSLEGPVQGGGLIAGEINLGPTEISVAEAVGAGAGARLEEVLHVLPPPRVATTLERARVGDPDPPQEVAAAGGLALDVLINAPNQIFVRGRGLDAELGGSVRLRGTTADLQPLGEFELRRGRIIILTQRIEFTSGTLTLVGDLDPQVNFVAQSRSGDITAIVTVSGRVSNPDITFSSQPPLPQDEVLAQLLFGRSAADLSAFQLAQLAAAAAELAGAGGPGILSQLRSATGLDNLDIITDESGATAVRAGRYISENAYLDLQTGSDGVSRAEIVIDLSDRVTARGSVGSDGNSTFGLFYERDY